MSFYGASPARVRLGLPFRTVPAGVPVGRRHVAAGGPEPPDAGEQPGECLLVSGDTNRYAALEEGDLVRFREPTEAARFRRR